jgi:polyisoprenoid-binding protein YceI
MTATGYAELTGEYTLDPAHSRIGFAARHAMVTKVRGSFNEFSGTTHINGGDLTKSAVTVTIQAASIDTRNAERDSHLRTNDFLQVVDYPQITFVSTAIRQHRPGHALADEDIFEVVGDLTIKGVTQSVTVPFTYEGTSLDPLGNTRIGFEGSTTINRKDFGVTWNATLETGGLLVGEKVILEFEISAIKQP